MNVVKIEKNQKENGESKKRYLLRSGKEDVKHILLMCSEIGKWTEGFIIKKWLNMKEEAADNHIFSCTNNAVVRCSSEANIRK